MNKKGTDEFIKNEIVFLVILIFSRQKHEHDPRWSSNYKAYPKVITNGFASVLTLCFPAMQNTFFKLKIFI